MPMDRYGWRPELVADLVGIDALWIEADRSARSGDAPGPVGSLPARRRGGPADHPPHDSTPSRSRRLRLRVRVVWSTASMSSSCLRFASPRRAIIARMLN